MPPSIRWNHQRYGVIGSTNDEARGLAEQGAPEGTVVVAEGQTAGRGRATHTWFSPEGKGLYTSLILRPTIDPQHLPSLTLVAGLAVCDALATFAPVPAQLKWPNDIWLLGRKVGGILSEVVTTPQGTTGVIIGIGINVNLRQNEFPPELQQTATSLAVVRGQPVDRELVLQSLLVTVAARYAEWQQRGWAALRGDYLARSAIEGRRVRAVFGADRREGIVRGVDDNGALLLQLPHGQLEAVITGDVEFM